MHGAAVWAEGIVVVGTSVKCSPDQGKGPVNCREPLKRPEEVKVKDSESPGQHNAALSDGSGRRPPVLRCPGVVAPCRGRQEKDRKRRSLSRQAAMAKLHEAM